MTLTEYQDYVHSLYQGDGSTPTDGSDEWNHRENMLHAAIRLWDSEAVMWNELWTTLTAASDGDKIAAAADVEYDMPTDFRFLGSYVRTTNASGGHTFWQVLNPEGAEPFKNTSVKGVYVTGNKSAGFVLNFMEQPTASETINYPYYKEPDEPAAAATVIEMSDPWFCVYYTLSKLHEHDGDGDRAVLALNTAESRLKNMKVRNGLLPHSQPNRPEDIIGGGFGEKGTWGISRYGAPL